MKSKFDLRHNIGFLSPESSDDLWLLSRLIEPGAEITAKTERSVYVLRGEEKVKVGRKTITLTIKLEKINFEGDVLRLGGKIISEGADHGWHTIEVRQFDEIKVCQEWKSWQIEQIKAAAVQPEPLALCVLDETEADVWIITNTAKHIAALKAPGTGKESGISHSQEFYGNVASILKNQKAKHFIIAGPGFAKEGLKKFIEERGILKISAVLSISSTGETGLQEVLKSGILKKIMKESRIAAETEAVERFLTELAKGGLAEYGLENVRAALEQGAVEIILVSEPKAREVEELLSSAKNYGAKVMIISKGHESGEKLYNLGGIAAILRFKLS